MKGDDWMRAGHDPGRQRPGATTIKGRTCWTMAKNGRTATAIVAAHPLITEGEDDGRRDYLAGRPVHAGEQLDMLTWRGWYPVRYESAGGTASVICLGLPGVADEIATRARVGARYRWPEEQR